MTVSATYPGSTGRLAYAMRVDGNVDIYLAAHPVRVYVSAGPFSVRALRSSVLGSANFQITVEGHLVDVD